MNRFRGKVGDKVLLAGGFNQLNMNPNHEFSLILTFGDLDWGVIYMRLLDGYLHNALRMMSFRILKHEGYSDISGNVELLDCSMCLISKADNISQYRHKDLVDKVNWFNFA